MKQEDTKTDNSDRGSTGTSNFNQHSSALLKRLKSEKKERQKRKETEMARLRAKIEKEQEEERRREEEKAEEKNRNRIRRLNTLQEGAEERRRQRDYYKDFANNSPQRTPLYKVLEEKFTLQVEMPELQRRKDLLAQKREHFVPMRLEDINKHAKEYGDQKEKLKKRNPKTPMLKMPEDQYQLLLEKEREKFSAQNEETERRKILNEKKEEFDRKVKAEFQPKKDLLKHVEIEMYKRRSEVPKGIKFPDPFPKPSSLRIMPREKSVRVPLRQAESITTDRPKALDSEYLKNRRIIRKKIEDDIAKGNLTDRKILSREDTARRLEKVVKNMGKSPYDLKAIEAEDKINGFYIQSIKAKLEELNV